MPYAESMAELLDLIQNHTLWCTSESKQESLSRVDPLVPLIDHDLSDLGITDPNLDHVREMHPI